MANFLDHLNEELARNSRADLESAARAIFNVMWQEINSGEAAKLIRILPAELQDLWVDSSEYLDQAYKQQGIVMPFRNRTEAGKQLANALARFRGKDCIVYALPRGGLPIGYEVAIALHAPLDVILVRKLKAPFQPELALGAVVDGEHPEVVLNEAALEIYDPDGEAVKAAAALELKEIHRRRVMYMASRQPEQATGRTAIIVDDGLATGSTARAAVKALRRQHPKRLVLAVPVAPSETADILGQEVDDLVSLETHADFGSVSMYYDEFPQVTDQEVVTILAQAREEHRRQSTQAEHDNKM